MNKCILIGRLCTEPDMRTTQSGTTVTTYRIAVDRQFKKEGQPDADFLTCVAWGKNGQFAEKYLRKGMKIALEGRIQTRSYDDKDGKKVYVTEIMVEHHEFVEKKSEDSRTEPAPYTQSAESGYSSGSRDDFIEITCDEDLPF